MNKKVFTGGQVVLPDSVVTASLVVEGEKMCIRDRVYVDFTARGIQRKLLHMRLVL